MMMTEATLCELKIVLRVINRTGPLSLKPFVFNRVKTVAFQPAPATIRNSCLGSLVSLQPLSNYTLSAVSASSAMPGRFFPSVASSRRFKVTDPVSADPLMSTLFIGAVILSTYGTWYVGEHLLPQGAKRLYPTGEGVVDDHTTSEAPNASDTHTSLVFAPTGFESLVGMQDYIVAAIPFFFVLMAWEAWLMYISSFKPVAAQYGAVDTWSSLAAGTAQTLMQMLAKPFWPMTLIYCFLWDNLRITNGFADNDSWTVAGLCFVLGDLSYYWYHRNAHEIHFLWAGHNVHHSGEHYNLSTALRQSWQQALLSGIWSLPMAFFLPPRSYMLAQQWVTLYQFWVHTSLVRRLPEIVELFLVTPSHHRMHHDRRLHKNFAGVFIVWDRLFGTFHDEFIDVNPVADVDMPDSVEPHVDPLRRTRRDVPPLPENGGEDMAYYGITDVIKSWADVVPQQLIWDKIRRLLAHKPTLHAAVHNLVVGPGFHTSKARRPLPAIAPDEMPRIRVDVSAVTVAAKVYVSLAFAWTLYAFGAIMLRSSQLTVAESSVALMFVLIGLTNQGMIYDRWQWAFVLEVFRCAIGVVGCANFPFDYCAEYHLALLATVFVFRASIFA
jgi:sterol desaturase/sphingolipid hydroxylase (fatty acid hydroxylase superfamily)